MSKDTRTRPVRVVKRDDREREGDETRSIEISMMRMLMRKYPEKAQDVAVDLFKIPLTKAPT